MIRFQHVFKSFPNGALALKDVSFHVSKGEFVFLTGHSGAGKSTIMKLMFAEQRPTQGDVRVSGFALADMGHREIPRLRRKLGVVFQDFRLLDDRTAAENVAFALEVTGARRDTIPARVMRVLTQVGLAAKARAYPRELSGGEQQRVAIARALVNDPPVLLADEPTGALDSKTAEEILGLFQQLNAEEGISIILVTHDANVAAHAKRTIRIKDGLIENDDAVTKAAAGIEWPGPGGLGGASPPTLAVTPAAIAERTGLL